jgi:hypothetical protein
LLVGSAEEMEGGDEFPAGLSLAPLIHEFAWRRVGKDSGVLELCMWPVRAVGPFAPQRTLLYAEVGHEVCCLR